MEFSPGEQGRLGIASTAIRRRLGGRSGNLAGVLTFRWRNQISAPTAESRLHLAREFQAHPVTILDRWRSSSLVRALVTTRTDWRQADPAGRAFKRSFAAVPYCTPAARLTGAPLRRGKQYSTTPFTGPVML